MRFSVSVLLLGVSVGASAQVTTSFRSDGPNLMATGVPFQAERRSHMEQTLGDGNRTVRDVTETMARDMDGRFYDRMEFTSGAVGAGSAGKVSYLLLDPATHSEASWGDQKKSGTRMKISAKSHVTVRPSPLAASAGQARLPKNKTVVTTEQLGTKTIAGLAAVGTRTVTTVPAGVIGNEREIRATHDEWKADGIDIPLLVEDDNPLTGKERLEVVTYSIAAPDPGLFNVPADVTLRETSLPIPPPMMQKPPVPPAGQ